MQLDLARLHKMATIKVSILFALFLVSPGAWATVSYTGISGYSVITGASPTFDVFGAVLITSGASSSSYTCSETGVCNTCIGGSVVPTAACSYRTVFPATNVTIAMHTNAVVSGSQWRVCNGSTEITSSGTLGSSTLTSADFSWTMSWSTLCDSLNSTTSTGCTTAGLNKTLTIGYAASGQACGAITDKIDFNMHVSPFDNSVNSDASADGSNQEAIQFGLFPGDEKAYLLDALFTHDSSFPQRSVGGLYWSKLLFFYAPATTVAGANITNSSANYISLAVATDGTVEKDYLDGLENNVNYCFRMANEDTAGVIAFYSSTSLTAACVKPSEVVGLLADKKCFIATAAFGSNLDPHVTSFRQFRNEFLLNNFLGKHFVKTYYKYSPPLAHFISEHEFLRTATRWLLWPLLAFVEISLAWGIWTGLCLLLITLMISKILLKKLKWPKLIGRTP